MAFRQSSRGLIFVILLMMFGLTNSPCSLATGVIVRAGLLARYPLDRLVEYSIL